MKFIIALLGFIATVTAWDSVVSNFLSKVVSKDSTLNIDNPALAFCGFEKHQCDIAPYCIWDAQYQICKRAFSPVLEQNSNSNITSFNSTSSYNNSTHNSTIGYNSTFLLESEFAAVNCTNQAFQNCSITYGCAWNYTQNFCQLNNTRKFLESELAAVNCTNYTFQNCSRTYGCAWNYTYNFCQLNNTRKFILEWSNSTSNYTNSTSGFNRTFTLESEFAAVYCTNQTFQNCSRNQGCAWNYTYNFCQFNNTKKFFLESEFAAVNCTNQAFQNCSRTQGCAWNYTYNFCQLNNTKKFFLKSKFAAVNCTNSTFQNCSRTYGCAWNYTYNFCQLNNTRKFVLEWSNSTSNYTNSTSGFNRTFTLEYEFAPVNCTNQTFYNCSKVNGCAWNYTYNFCQLNNTKKFFLESEFAAVNCTNSTFQNCSRTYGCAWNYTYNFCQLNNTRKFVLEWSNSTSNYTNSTSGFNRTFTLEYEFAPVNCTNQTFYNCSKVNGCAWNYTYNFCQLNNTKKFFLESKFAAVNCTNSTFQNCSRTYGCAWNYTYNFCQLNNTRKFVLEWSNSTSNYTNSTSGFNRTFTLEYEFAPVNCTNQTFYNCSKVNGCAWNYTRNICQQNSTRQFFLEQSNSTNSTGSFNVTLFNFNGFNFTMNSTNQTSNQSFNLSSSYINQTERAFRLCNELNKTECIYANNCKWAKNSSCIYSNSTLQAPFVHKLLSLQRD
ncbi:hypothetical protein ABPG72_003415 [Tetrahymena utriculariae]